MKYLSHTITAGVIIVSVLAGDWVIRFYLLKESQTRHPTVVASNPNLAQPPPTPQSRINEWQEFHQAREQALHDNPDLAAEYQQLRADIQKQEDDVNAAMIKADPKIAPILAKLALLRHSTPLSAPTANNANPGTITR